MARSQIVDLAFIGVGLLFIAFGLYAKRVDANTPGQNKIWLRPVVAGVVLIAVAIFLFFFRHHN